MNEQLIIAAERGDTITLRSLFSASANINAQDARDRTPMIAATHGNYADTVQSLIDEQHNYDRLLAAAREQLGENAVAAAWAERRALALKQADAEALALAALAKGDLGRRSQQNGASFVLPLGKGTSDEPKLC